MGRFVIGISSSFVGLQAQFGGKGGVVGADHFEEEISGLAIGHRESLAGLGLVAPRQIGLRPTLRKRPPMALKTGLAEVPAP